MVVPWVVWGFFKLITPFIDPHTREKLKFNEDMTQYVPPEQLWTEYPGGKLEFEYDHSVYWPAFVKLAHDRREAHKARWIAGGKHVGEFEDYLNGPLEQGVAPPPSQEETSFEGQPEPAVETAKAAPITGEETKVEDLKVETLKIDDQTAEANQAEEKPVESKENVKSAAAEA